MRDILTMITHPLGIQFGYWMLTIALLAGAFLLHVLMKRAYEEMRRGQRLVAVGVLWIAISPLIVGYGEGVAVAIAQARTTQAPSLLSPPRQAQVLDPRFEAPKSDLPGYAHYWIHIMGGMVLIGAGLGLNARAKRGY
ncbi:hypothetical protein [Azospirillum canadense]|uniref:hypothetical protein n=1 Tax=Azospirillum canadense TaxID=403962 RepID=UPI0022267DB5|nr:hypothetical protein [Azospirillum canadense]MCW2236831.1 hypothetical protein [Azospirillum canadense]